MTMLPWYARSLRYAQRSLAIRRARGDVWGQGQTLGFSGVTLYAASRYDEGVDACREAIRLLKRTGDQWEVNTASWNLAIRLLPQGRLACRGRGRTRDVLLGHGDRRRDLGRGGTVGVDPRERWSRRPHADRGRARAQQRRPEHDRGAAVGRCPLRHPGRRPGPRRGRGRAGGDMVRGRRTPPGVRRSRRILERHIARLAVERPRRTTRPAAPGCCGPAPPTSDERASGPSAIATTPRTPSAKPACSPA